MIGHEKRGAPRVPYISEVECEGAGNRLIARTSDISASGVFIHSNLGCEAGSILKLRFSVTSTQIETIGEVCYSIPYIGMGVRFLDLKPEYHAAIERLIESERDQRECEKVETQGRPIISSGVEPVDTLLGGLERGHLYLAHGDGSGKSLFGIEFLIKGLKQGRHCALITTQRREDAVRRFARLGYDCSEDVRAGALVLFKYSHDTVAQIQMQSRIEPLLGDLGPILDQSSPERVVFDPLDNLLAGAKQDDVAARANELAVWVRSFGATVVLVTNEENRGVIESLTPFVSESFRFEVRESSDRVVRFLSFEKSTGIPDQAVRVDPSRGISLLEDHQAFPERIQTKPGDSTSAARRLTGRGWTPNKPAARLSPAPQSEVQDSPADMCSTPLAKAPDDPATAEAVEEAHGAFFAMLDELQSFASSLDPDVDEEESIVIPCDPLNARMAEPEVAGFTTSPID